MKKIEQLSLYGNNLTTLEDGSLKPLAGSLKMLFLQENNMESLPKAVEDCSSLTELHAWDNGMKDISKVDFSKLPELTELNLMHNEITQIPENAFAKNTKLDGLDLFDNDLTSVSPDILPNGVSLRKLDLKFNNMQIIDKKLINKSQSYNKFYPQKSAMELRLEKSGDQEMKWSQQLSALDLMFWYEETNDAKKKELQSVDEYKEYLKEQGYAEGDFTKTLKDLSYQWDIVTKIQKKDTNGRFVTIDQRINEGKADEMDGSFKFTEDGTYRVVKDVYGYMSSMRNFLFEAKSNEVTIENKKEDKKEDKTTATTSTSQIATIKKKEKQIVVDFEFLGSKYAYRKADLDSNVNQVTEVHYSTIYEFKKNAKNVFSIYMIPKDLERAKQELRKRNLSKETEQKRLKEIDEHIKEYEQNKDLQKQFDYVFINDYTEKAKNDLLKIIEKRRAE